MKELKKEFWKYMMFAVMGMIGLSGTILVDTFFVSHRLGPDGLAALNIAIAIFGLMNGLAMMIGIGGASRYTILKSQEHHHKANQTFTLSFAMALGMGILFLLTGLYGSSWLAQCLGANQVSSAFGLSLLRGCIGIIIVACLFAFLWGLKGMWLAFPFVELMTMLIGKLKFRYGMLASNE